MDFGSMPVGVRGQTQGLAVTNNTAQTVVLGDISVSGDFELATTCASVPARSTCVLHLAFRPTARGARAGEIIIRTVSESTPYRVVLSGVGEANLVPQLRVAPGQIGFGNALVGPLSGHEPVDLVNMGEVPVVLGVITASPDFVVDNRCGASIAVGGRCQLLMSFYPRGTGSRIGSLHVGSNAGNGPHSVTLSGTGCTIPSVPRGRLPAVVCNP
jgi:hypothetical protein